MNLVIGNGLIGRHLYYKLRSDAILTTRKELELSSDRWELPKCSTAYICAGVTSTKECEEHPKEAKLVNVTNTVKLAEKLKPSQVVWISSERVYDGSKAYREISDEVCPTTEYGRQKAETERLLLDLGVTVVRFSKVIGWDIPLFEGWISNLDNDLPIHPYSNMSMSPLPVSFAVDVLIKARGGLFQVSGTQDISYSRIAYHIANYMGKDLKLVQPIEGESHPYTTLKSNIPDIDIPDVWETIQGWCQNRLPIRA